LDGDITKRTRKKGEGLHPTKKASQIVAVNNTKGKSRWVGWNRTASSDQKGKRNDFVTGTGQFADGEERIPR